jgi:hypothetical protein
MNFLNKLFGKKSKQDLRPFITSERTPEQEEMFREQRILKDALGMEHGNDHQNWLRLHQVLWDYEKRIKHLESQVGTRKGGGDEIV